MTQIKTWRKKQNKMVSDIFFEQDTLFKKNFKNNNDSLFFVINKDKNFDSDNLKLTIVKIKKMKNFYIKKTFHISKKDNHSMLFRICKENYNPNNGVYLGPAYINHFSIIFKNKKYKLFNKTILFKTSKKDFFLTPSKEEWFNSLSQKHKIEALFKNEDNYNSI